MNKLGVGMLLCIQEKDGTIFSYYTCEHTSGAYSLPLANEVCSKVMFLHASVILSMVGGVRATNICPLLCMPHLCHT